MSAFTFARRDEWKWTAMIAQPEYVTPSLFEECVDRGGEEEGYFSFRRDAVRALREGKAVQIMHVGPFL